MQIKSPELPCTARSSGLCNQSAVLLSAVIDPLGNSTSGPHLAGRQLDVHAAPLKRSPLLVPVPGAVEVDGAGSGDGPTDGPGAPDPGGAERRLGEYQCQGYTEDQVCKGGEHELLHLLGAPEDTVCHQFCGDHKVEGGEDPQKDAAHREGRNGGLIQEQIEKIPPCEEVQQHQRHTEQPHQLHSGAEAHRRCRAPVRRKASS